MAIEPTPELTCDCAVIDPANGDHAGFRWSVGLLTGPVRADRHFPCLHELLTIGGLHGKLTVLRRHIFPDAANFARVLSSNKQRRLILGEERSGHFCIHWPKAK